MDMNQANYRNVLVIGDNYVNTMILTRCLNLFHFNTKVCSEKDTVRSIRRNNFDIIFLYHKHSEDSGIRLTEVIRKLKRDKNKTIIYILADCVTAIILKMYRDLGANQVFELPFKMELFLKDVSKYFSELNLFTTIEDKKHNVIDSYEWCSIKTAFLDIKEIDLEAGVKNSLGNPTLFIQIFRLVLKEMSSILTVINEKEEFSLEEIKKRLHSMKGVLPYIGANSLFEDTRKLEADLKQGYFMAALERLIDYSKQLRALQEKLQEALENYNTLMELNKEENGGDSQPNPVEGYEQCIRNTIYYIKLYEYDRILQELDKLTRLDEEHSELYRMIADSIKEYDYEGALKLIQSEYRMN